MKYEVIFENSREIERVIATINSDSATEYQVYQQALTCIKEFCDLHNYKIPYYRIWNTSATEQKPSRTCIDAGSHTEFFYISPAVDWREKETADGET